MERKLEPYQEDFVTNIIKTLGKHQSVCAQLATGGGKTIVFSAICNRYVKNTPNDVLILVHRQELLRQTRKTIFDWYDIIAQEISANVKGLHYIPMFDEKPRVYVAMVETFDRRAKNSFFIDNLKQVGMVIVDECHLSNFKKIFQHFPEALRIGFSATPLAATKKDPLKNWYEKIVCGVSIKDLIEHNKTNQTRGVVQDVTYVKKNIDRQAIIQKHEAAGLFQTADQEFNQDIIGAEMSNKKMIQNTIDAYLKHAYGKKMLVFNANVEHSKLVTAAMVDSGLNARHLDGTSEDTYRKECFSWLKKTPNAILCNVGIATTGFDDTSIEGCIINKLTKSLTLWKQMCGRSARPYEYPDGTFKEHHIILDLGDNVIGGGHGEWSDDINWEEMFYNPKKPKQGVAPVKLCPECGYLNPASARVCKGEEPGLEEGDVIYCGYVFPLADIEEGEEPKLEMVLVSKNVNVKQIMEYFASRPLYASFYETARQVAWFARQDIKYDLLTEDEFQQIYDSGYPKIKEWIKLAGKKNNGWFTSEYKKKLLEELTKLEFDVDFKTKENESISIGEDNGEED